MSRFTAPIVLVLAAVLAPFAPAAASTAEEFLNAPVWYLEYQVTVTSSYSGSYDSFHGKVSFTSKLERVMTDRKELNLRSQGLGPIGMGAMAGTTGGAAPSIAEQQKLSMQMLSGIDHQANWLAAGSGVNENATEEDIAADTTPSSPSRIDYTRVEVGKGLVDETGTKYDCTTTTTIRGTGNVLVMGMGSIIFEMDTAEKTYALVLPVGTSPTGDGVTRETVTVTTVAGEAPNEERKTDPVVGSYPERITLDTPQQGGTSGGALIRGALDPVSGKISGEQTFPAHYPDGAENAPATVVFKYTLTMTPKK